MSTCRSSPSPLVDPSRMFVLNQAGDTSDQVLCCPRPLPLPLSLLPGWASRGSWELSCPQGCQLSLRRGPANSSGGGSCLGSAWRGWSREAQPECKPDVVAARLETGVGGCVGRPGDLPRPFVGMAGRGCSRGEGGPRGAGRGAGCRRPYEPGNPRLTCSLSRAGPQLPELLSDSPSGSSRCGFQEGSLVPGQLAAGQAGRSRYGYKSGIIGSC